MTSLPHTVASEAPPTPRQRTSARCLAGLFAIVGALGFLLYSPTLHFGFHYDDYYFIRPHSVSDVVGALSGSWYPSGPMVPFYRPLTVAFHALRFRWLGLDSSAYHVVSIVLLGAVAALTGWFVWFTTLRWRPAFAAALLTVAHPATVHSMGAFVTNQMHSLEALVVMSALCVWASTCRRRNTTWGWIAIAALAVVAFLFKEDGISLWPTILALHLVHRRYVRQAPPVPRWALALAAVEIAALILLRQWALHGLGGYGAIPPAEMLANALRGPRRVLLYRDSSASWAYLPTAMLTIGLYLWGLVATLRARNPVAIGLVGAGAILLLAFNVTFIFASKMEQWYLLAIGSAILLTASLEAIVPDGRRVLWTALMTCLVLGFGVLDRTLIAQYSPYSEKTLRLDREVITWPAVSYEIREFLQRKPSAGLSDVTSTALEDLPVIAFGMSDPIVESPTGTSMRTLCGRADFYVNSNRAGLSFATRSTGASSMTIADEAGAASLALGASWNPVSRTFPARRGNRRTHLVVTTAGCVVLEDIVTF